MKILIPQPLPHMPEIAEILGRDHEIVGAASTSEADLLEAVGDVEGFVATGMDVSAAVLAASPRLRVVGTPQVGFDRIDVAAATELGVPVISAAGAAPDAVAEFALALMLSLTRRITRSDRDLRGTDGWKSRPKYAEPKRELGRELRGATVGIAGVGFIGVALAKLASVAFDCRVLGYDPFVDTDAMASNGIEKVDELRDLASRVDFLVLHVPLNAATRHLVNAEILAAMKPTAFVLNVARGGVLNEDALVEAIEAGRLAGAALDVYETEPLAADSPLLRCDGIILTPHIAGVSFESNAARAVAFSERFLSVLGGERPDGLANPKVWDAYLERKSALERTVAR